MVCKSINRYENTSESLKKAISKKLMAPGGIGRQIIVEHSVNLQLPKVSMIDL